MIIIVNIYIDNFLFTSTTILVFKNLKKNLAKVYNMKDLKEIKTIILQQITSNLAIKTLKISKSVYIKNLFQKDNLINKNISIP